MAGQEVSVLSRTPFYNLKGCCPNRPDLCSTLDRHTCEQFIEDKECPRWWRHRTGIIAHQHTYKRCFIQSECEAILPDRANDNRLNDHVLYLIGDNTGDIRHICHCDGGAERQVFFEMGKDFLCLSLGVAKQAVKDVGLPCLGMAG